jgi:hypothetical protein
MEDGTAMQGLAEQTTCRIALPPDAREGLYRWRVRGVGANGLTVGEPSDWAYVAVTASSQASGDRGQ